MSCSDSCCRRRSSKSATHNADPAAVVRRKSIESTGISCKSRAIVPNLYQSYSLALGQIRLPVRFFYVPCIPQAPLSYECSLLFLWELSELEVTPMVQRSCPITSQDQEQRSTRNRYEIDWKQDNELGNLSKREWRVNSRLFRLPKSLDWIITILVQYSCVSNKLLESLIE